MYPLDIILIFYAFQTTDSEDDTRKQSAARVQNPEGYIILPGKTHSTYSYPETLITMDRVHLGKNWT